LNEWAKYVMPIAPAMIECQVAARIEATGMQGSLLPVSGQPSSTKLHVAFDRSGETRLLTRLTFQP
jgi:hypothetical protein